jgi:hypothetical protein
MVFFPENRDATLDLIRLLKASIGGRKGGLARTNVGVLRCRESIIRGGIAMSTLPAIVGAKTMRVRVPARQVVNRRAIAKMRELKQQARSEVRG